MAWYWPTIEDESSAENATKAAVGVSGFIAAVTGLAARATCTAGLGFAAAAFGPLRSPVCPVR